MILNTLFGKTVKIAENQRVLAFKNQQLVSVLTPGNHKFFDLKNEYEFISDYGI